MSGHDTFDDFELMVLVHEAKLETKEAKIPTIVRISAGAHMVKTDRNSNGVFQQPLHITVEQGNEQITVEVLNAHEHVLATLKLDTLANVLRPENLQPETVYSMTPNSRSVRNPKVKLTTMVYKEEDVEKGFLAGAGGDVDVLVSGQLRKAKQLVKNAGIEGGYSEMEVLKHACAGPLEVFEGLGKTQAVYMAVRGPPQSRHWTLGVWNDQGDFESEANPLRQIDITKIQSVQADPTRHHVFVVNYFDDARMRQTMTFRRIDRARDVWVEILHLMVTQARSKQLGAKSEKRTTRGSGFSYDSTAS